MSYEEIFILGWNLNLAMFILNLFIAFKTLNSKPKEVLYKENEALNKLKIEFDKYYPNRKYETLLTYLIPFAAFYRMSFRLIEMKFFFDKNRDCTLFDYMVYKYQNDIEFAKNKINQ